MKIKELTLYTHKLTEQKAFYTSVLGCDLVEESPIGFSVQLGYTKLSFQESDVPYIYHYCFLIPSNKLEEAVEWLKARLDVVNIEGGSVTNWFEDWNAKSVYFYDASGNIAELIVRYDLKNETSKPFGLEDIISVNEIGMPTKDIVKINTAIESELGSKFWKGDWERFGTNGTQDGLFLLVNNDEKKEWFPTDLFTASSPFRAKVTVDKQEFDIAFENEELIKY